MNATPSSMFTGLGFIIVAALVVIAMLMGNRQRHRAGLNWWIGLGVLLLVVSAFMGYSTIRLSSVKEERHAGRSFLSDQLAEMKGEIRSGIETAREAMRNGMDELGSSLEDAKRAVASASTGKTTNRTNRGNTTVVVTNNRLSNTPRQAQYWSVELKHDERSTKKQVVETKLFTKAVESIERWVADRMPIRQNVDLPLDADYLKAQGVFPDPVQFDEESFPGTAGDSTESIYGGSLKVMLHPAMQESLLDMGYDKLQDNLQSIQVLKQSIVFASILGITLLAGLIAITKRYFTVS